MTFPSVGQCRFYLLRRMLLNFLTSGSSPRLRIRTSQWRFRGARERAIGFASCTEMAPVNPCEGRHRGLTTRWWTSINADSVSQACDRAADASWCGWQRGMVATSVPGELG